MNRTKYKPEYFKAFPLHHAAAKGHVMEFQRQLNDGANPYQPTSEGLTPMHAAVANNSEAVLDVLLKRYEEDWSIACDTIRHRFLWKVEQGGWKNRPILIAWTEAECQATVSHVASCPAGIPLNLQVFVLLRQPQQGHQFVALDVCNRDKWWETIRYIQQLLPNGVLSLDRSDLRVNTINYLHLACSYAKKEIIVKLISKGASLAVHSGEEHSPPFMAACEALRKDIVELLMTRYSDRFDPGVCDKQDYNALHRMMLRQHAGMVKLIVTHMLKYRASKYRETESQALNQIFRYDAVDYQYISIWSFAQSVPMKKLCSSYAILARINLETRVEGYGLVLTTFISQGIALDYCFEEIGLNLELLRLHSDCSTMNILHTLIRCKRLSFVRDLYEKHGTLVKEIFEQEDSAYKPAYELLRNLIQNMDEAGISFVLEHHRVYYAQDMKKLLNSVLKQQQGMKEAAYARFYAIMTKTIPTLKLAVDEDKNSSESQENAFYDFVQKLNDSFTKTVTQLEANGKRLEDYVDSNRRTVLHVAVDWSRKDLIEKLLARNVDVMVKDVKGCLPIHLVRGSESIFEMLLAKNELGQLAFVNEAGYNLLHISCMNGLRGSALEKLLESGLDVNEAAPDGNVPLSLATCCGTVRFLLQHEARVDLLNGDLLRNRLPCMQYCAAWELIPHIARLEWFKKCAYVFLPWMVGSQNRDFFSCSNQRDLEKHEDIRRLLFDSLYEHSKEQASELFARVCNKAIVCCARWFLEYDYELDYDHRVYYGMTPLLGLLSYMEEPNYDVVEKLLHKPLDVNAIDDRNRNAIIALASHFKWAKHYGHSVETFRLLLKRGAKLDEQDYFGNTALHYAFEHQQWDLVQFLLEKGANANVKNACNKMPSDLIPAFNRHLFAFIR